ncbi:MAG: phospho-N-acetylmuramoyl-pentapeptide-transferase [Ruminococcaceae bacterium]|nr:phospho-N-acetylmuramoyl-pentapeptide-transferase [Oscillospiraceae bacterium]
MNEILISFAISTIICLLMTPLLIPFLRRLKFGQSIREEGPSWHRIKSGTPTMGGIGFIVASLGSSLVVMITRYGFRYDLLIPLLTAFAYGVVGFADDFIKVVKKRNLGLSAKAKFIAQLFVAILSTISMNYMGYISGELIIPFISVTVDIGLWIIPLTILVQLSVVNSVNLTDGLDGLAAGITLLVGLFFAIMSIICNEPIGIFIGAVVGGCLAFLLFNAHPAKVFMGDTGSLFLGGAIAVTASMLKMPLVLVIVGGVYLAETLSVIMQVTSFKLTGKRIFKMSPLHHHFEMCGLNETKIVLLFCAATLILCIVGYLCVINLF